MSSNDRPTIPESVCVSRANTGTKVQASQLPRPSLFSRCSAASKVPFHPVRRYNIHAPPNLVVLNLNIQGGGLEVFGVVYVNNGEGSSPLKPRKSGEMVSGPVVNVYPLSSYTFGSKEAKREKDTSVADRLARMKEKCVPRL